MVHVVKIDEMKRERKTQSVEEENRVHWEIVATGVVWTWQLPNNKWTRKEKQWKERGNEGILLVVPQTTRLTKKTHLRGLFFFYFFFLGYTHLVSVFLFLFLWFVFPCIFHFFFSFSFFHSIILICFGSFGLYFFKYFINCKTHP